MYGPNGGWGSMKPSFTNAAQTRERGSILPLVAAGMTAILGVTALSLDVGNVLVAQGQLKNAADAAAVVGAAALANPGVGGAVPNLTLAETTAKTALLNLKNQSNGVAAVEATLVKAGGWDTANPQLGLQTWVPGGTMVPALKVVLEKKGNLNQAVSSLFSSVLGINSFSPLVTVVAIGDYAPATANPNQLLPVALSQCLFEQFWDSKTQQPKLATKTTPLCTDCPNQTIGQPFVIRVGSNWGSNVIVGETTAACPATGMWTTFTMGTNSDADVKAFINGYGPKLTLGQSIWIYQAQGAKTNLYGELNGLGMPLGAFMPVISGNVTPGSWAPIEAYACVKIIASTGGNDKAIDFQLLPASNEVIPGVTNTGFNCKLSGSGVSSKTYLVSPPVIVN